MTPQQRPSLADVAEDYQRFLNGGIKAEMAAEYRNEVSSVDLAALKRLSESMLKTRCEDPVWIATGGSKFLKVFGIATEDKGDIVARVTRPPGRPGSGLQDADEVGRTLLSEVATVEWVQRNTTIPVPKIYGYNSDAACEVGGAFILEERVIGRTGDPSLARNPDKYSKYIAQLTDYYGQLLSSPVSAIGIFVPGKEPAIGPASPGFGPFFSSDAWCRAHAKKTRAFLNSDEFVPEWKRWHRSSPSREPDLEHIQAHFKRALEAYEVLAEKHQGEAEVFVLKHTDLCSNNVLVDYDDPSIVLAIIDWDRAVTVPIWELIDLPEVLGGGPFAGPIEEELKAAVWKRLFQSQPQIKQSLQDAGARHRVRRMLSDMRYYTGPAGPYDINTELSEVRSELGLGDNGHKVNSQVH